MAGLTTLIDLHDDCHSVEVVESVAVQRDKDGNVVCVSDVAWNRRAYLGYPWDDHTVFDEASVLADVIAAKEQSRGDIEALRLACDIVLAELDGGAE